MNAHISTKDIALLRQAGMTEEDLNHSLAVAERALDIAGRTGADLDMNFIARGALLHDLGKVRTHGLEHGEVGAALGAELGLPEEILAIMKKHIRGGMTRAEALELGLPDIDYTLHRLEERIIIYADRLVDIIGDGVEPDPLRAEERFPEILTTIVRYGKNETTLNRYLRYHQEIQGFITARS
ncbi:MAG: HDIG domain-containing protein [Desulfomicrobium sp.]|nr:HDIG domain-containing protein [Desulfomicrobium sp.]MDP3430781.1 HDIG domain-containing protein [Desulfomicrobium sp.]